MSGNYNPPPNSNLIGGYAQQVPLYPINASGLPSAPGHAPQPPSPGITNPAYFGNQAYPSQLPPGAAPHAYQQPQFANNPQMNIQPSPSEPSSKRPLPTPARRPASVIYPPQTMPTSSFQSPPIPTGIPVHQRSMTFDPAAYNAMMIGQGQGMGMPSGVNNVGFNNSGGGARPASVHFPPGWNPYPSSPVGQPAGPSSFSGPGRPKKDADLPPLPPTSNVTPPMTPGSGIVTGKKALPTAPGNANGTAINMGGVPGWNAFPANGPTTPSASSPPEKRPLPTPSQSLPRISTIIPNAQNSTAATIPSTINTNGIHKSLVNVAAGGSVTVAPTPSPSSPTKRALPAAPGNGGIQPGTINLPTSPPSSNPTPQVRATPPPTSAPSSYASARSVFSNAAASSSTSSSGFTTAPSSFTAANTRPSSYSAPSPPPTGAPRSNASDNSGGEVDKRPLWKRMAASQASSRPRSVFGHRRGVGSVDAGPGETNPAASPNNSKAGGESISETGSNKPVARRRDTQPNPPTSQPMDSQNTSAQHVSKLGNTSSSSSTGSVQSPSRHAPLPTPPSPATANTTARVAAKSGANDDKPQTQSTNPTSKRPIGVQPTPIKPYQPKSKQPKVSEQPANVTSNAAPSQSRATPSTSKTPVTAAQPTPILPYQPKARQAKEPQQPKEPQPQAVVQTGTGGKVRFSQETPKAQAVDSVVKPQAGRSPSRAVAASPPRASAMKVGSAKSPPRAEASGSAGKGEAHSRVGSSGTGQSRIPQPNQPPTQHPQHQQTQNHPPQHQPQPPARTQATPPAPQISMALRFASMDLQDEARATDRDWAKWALVSSHEVATKPVPLSGAPAPITPPAPVQRKDSGRRRSASTGAPIVSLEDSPPPPAIMVRRGSFDGASASSEVHASGSGNGMDTAALVQAASTNGGMRRGGARPMPNPGSRAQANQAPAPVQGPHAHGRVPSVEEPYPQYKPSDTDSEEDEDDDTNPRITVSIAPPQISVSSPGDVPSIHIEGEDDVNVPGITFTIDEPEPSTSPNSSAPVVNAASVPIFSFDGPDDDQTINTGANDGGEGKRKKHKREKSVKEEEDERERARQLAKTRPLPPKIKKNSARCGKCDKHILGRIVSAMNARWHPECFRCSVCETFLEHVSSYEHDDRPYCHLDYHELFAPRCFHCKTPIMEEHFITLDDDALGQRTYHEQHFFCAECGDPFLAPKQERKTRQLDNGMLEVLDQDDEVGFTVYKGHPYCEACHVRLRMPKCKRCKKSIRPGDQAIEALGGKWCWECFTCNRCSKPFEDPQFYEHDRKPFCQPCYSILLVNQLG